MVITIISEPDKPVYNVMNYLPISLHNCDIKNVLKIIADWVNTALQPLIHPDQVSFVAKRQARDGTRRILNLIQLAKLSSSEFVLPRRGESVQQG